MKHNINKNRIQIFIISIAALVITFVGTDIYYNASLSSVDAQSGASRPEALYDDPEHDEEEEDNPDKWSTWNAEQAQRHQEILDRYLGHQKKESNSRVITAPSNIPLLHSGGAIGDTVESYGNGGVVGKWVNRGPKNMPGAFKFSEPLEGTDTIYSVTWNHYSDEYNSKTYIHRGTIYNPNTNTGGDDFVRLTGHWPNRFHDLIALKVEGKTRLIVGVDKGPVYYSDDEGVSWNKSSGLPSSVMSTIVNRQDNHRIYTTDGNGVYYSDDFAENFSLLHSFGSSAGTVLYTPRYASQPNASDVYLGRSGDFYVLNSAKNDFDFKGTYTSSHGTTRLSIGGDSRKIYVTENKNYWVSTTLGDSWTEKFPKGNYYGDRSGKLRVGYFIGVSPEDPDIVIGGHVHPVFSKDGLDTDVSDKTGWGRYQNGTGLSLPDYYDRIRFNYHPDFWTNNFYYNKDGDLYTLRNSDGGVFISYKEWETLPVNGNLDESYYRNIALLNAPSSLIYRYTLFTGHKHPNHISYSTQDQGSHSPVSENQGDLLDFHQIIGGDGPQVWSRDGHKAWKWERYGDKVYSPVDIYDGSGNFKRIGSINSGFNSSESVTFTRSSNMGWSQAVIDHDQPGNRMWLLTKTLNRAEWDGTNITGTTITKGNNQVAALVQGQENPDLLWMLQGGVVYKSSNRGDSFGSAIATPFSATTSAWVRGDIGGGWVLPGNDQWILFCGPSNNAVGSILSKDGGNTWNDVTGIFPTGSDAQTGGVIGSPDGKYVFAGTDIGPYVFIVADEKWYPMGGNTAAYFNTTSIEYLESHDIVRFGTWGSGVWDYRIIDTIPLVDLLPSVYASDDDGNVASNVIDNDTTTRWSASGSGEWLAFKFDAAREINGLLIHFYKGNERQYNFDVEVSNNGEDWSSVQSGLTSSGTVDGMERFLIPNTITQFIRFVCSGNSENSWNSIVEAEFIGAVHITASDEKVPDETAEHAFDESDATKWLTYANSGWVQIEYLSEGSKTIQEYSITSANDVPGRDPHAWDIQGSANGTEWVILDTRTNECFSSRIEKKSFQVAVSGEYQHYKLVVHGAKDPDLNKLQIAEIEYSETVSGGVAPGALGSCIGSVSSEDENAPSETAAHAFDGLNSTKWLTFQNASWIQLDYFADESKVVSEYTITSASDLPGRDPHSWILEGSHDGVDWTTLDTRADESFDSRLQKKSFCVDNSESYEMYRLDINATQDPSLIELQVAEIELLENDACVEQMSSNGTVASSASNDGASSQSGGTESHASAIDSHETNSSSLSTTPLSSGTLYFSSSSSLSDDVASVTHILGGFQMNTLMAVSHFGSGIQSIAIPEGAVRYTIYSVKGELLISKGIALNNSIELDGSVPQGLLFIRFDSK